MFCSWKRLSQRVCNIQIRMYLAYLYVSHLDQIPDGIKASLDVLGSLVKSRFLCQGNCTSIVTKDFHWTRCTRLTSSLFGVDVTETGSCDELLSNKGAGTVTSSSSTFLPLTSFERNSFSRKTSNLATKVLPSDL